MSPPNAAGVSRKTASRGHVRGTLGRARLFSDAEVSGTVVNAPAVKSSSPP